MTGYLLLGLRERTARKQMTGGNAFVKMNKHCVPTVYERIRISEGPAAPVRFAAAEISDHGVLRVDFEKNGGMSRAKGSDRVYVYVYNSDTRDGILSAPAERRHGRLQMQLPNGWTERNTKLWGFVVDKEGHASMSTYIKISDATVSTDCTNHNQPEGIHPTPCNEASKVENASSIRCQPLFVGDVGMVYR